MNNFVKNILLLIIVLALSYYTAEYFGTWYDKFSPQYDNTLGVSKALLISLAGFPFAYIFFTILLFKLFSFGNRNKWIGWLLVPPLLFFGSGDIQHIYLPIVLGLIALGLSKLISTITTKSKQIN